MKKNGHPSAATGKTAHVNPGVECNGLRPGATGPLDLKAGVRGL